MTVLIQSAVFSQSKPNIVYLFVDDLGYGDVQINYPNGKIPTPNIDELARQGMRFTDGHSGAAVCSPSRYGLLTGRQFAREDWDKKIGNGDNKCMIEPQQVTVAEFLKGEGYNTACIGKWHLGQTWYDKYNNPKPLGSKTDYAKPTTDGPNDQGFDYFFGLHGASTSSPYTYMRNREVVALPTEKGRKGKPAATGWDFSKILGDMTVEALSYIDRMASEKKGEPFFLYFPFTSVHTPIYPGKDWQGKSDVGRYGDFVMETDWVVGQVIKKLKEHNLDENTIIIFASDNGSHGRANPAHINPHGAGSVKSQYGHNMNGDFRGLKGDMYEGGHRIPYIVQWSGHIEPNTVNHEMIMVEDFYATIAEILGKKTPKIAAEDSFSILPYLKGEKLENPIRNYMVMNTFFGFDFIRKGDWVYAPFRGSGGPYGNRNGQTKKELSILKQGSNGQLYNLKDDPAQEKNLWSERPDKVIELSELLLKHLDQGHSFGINK